MGVRFIDASLFFNEFELFELRLRLLRDYADLFYVVEATQTFTGTPRELVWPQHEDRFRSLCPRIEYHAIDIPSSVLDGSSKDAQWSREEYQRNQMHAATEIDASAWVLMSDADEIADPLTLDAALSRVDEAGFVCLQQRLSPYYLNAHRDVVWPGTVAVCPTRGLKRLPERMRNERNLNETRSSVMCGWHWTSLGGPDRVILKLHSYSEQALCRPEIANAPWISECMAKGMDFFRHDVRDVVVEYLSMDDPRIPDAARAVAQDYPYLVHKESA